ncbi:MAG: hypothetical protein ACRAVC_09250 [Trichormus sp.]
MRAIFIKLNFLLPIPNGQCPMPNAPCPIVVAFPLPLGEVIASLLFEIKLSHT